MKTYMKHIPSKFAFIITKLLSNSENCEWLKIFKNVDCVVTNHNEVQDMRANHKTTNQLLLCLQFGFLTPYWLSLHNTVTLLTLHEYFWCSWFCEFHSNNLFSFKNAQKPYYESKHFQILRKQSKFQAKALKSSKS